LSYFQFFRPFKISFAYLEIFVVYSAKVYNNPDLEIFVVYSAKVYNNPDLEIFVVYSPKAYNNLDFFHGSSIKVLKVLEVFNIIHLTFIY